MANNTPSYSANIAVRWFLTEITKKDHKAIFDHRGVDAPESKSSGIKKFGKQEWKTIKCRFDNQCAYCRKKPEKLTVDHLAMFNKYQGGLQHPRNVVPACAKCNSNRRKVNKEKAVNEYNTWDEHLKNVCKDVDEEEHTDRRNRIICHIEQYCCKSAKSDLTVGDDSIEKAELLYNSLTATIKTAV
jgi:hypothetical protein